MNQNGYKKKKHKIKVFNQIFKSKDVSTKESVFNESGTSFIAQDEKSSSICLTKNRLILKASPLVMTKHTVQNSKHPFDELINSKHIIKNNMNLTDKSEKENEPWILNPDRKNNSFADYDEENPFNSKIELKKLSILISNLNKNLEKTETKLMEEEMKDKFKKQWALLSKIADRLFLYIFLVSTIIILGGIINQVLRSIS